jgi:hypothetical protein
MEPPPCLKGAFLHIRENGGRIMLGFRCKAAILAITAAIAGSLATAGSAAAAYPSVKLQTCNSTAIDGIFWVKVDGQDQDGNPQSVEKYHDLHIGDCVDIDDRLWKMGQTVHITYDAFDSKGNGTDYLYSDCNLVTGFAQGVRTTCPIRQK